MGRSPQPNKLQSNSAGEQTTISFPGQELQSNYLRFSTLTISMQQRERLEVRLVRQ